MEVLEQRSEGKLVGAPMPRFSLYDGAGRLVDSNDLLGRGPVVVFFYPKDGTMVCTAEACAFRDVHEELQALGATVIGISGDSIESHARFAETHQLPYTLLSDPGGLVARRFGVERPLGMLPGRETFVIDRTGIVRGQFRSLLFASRHMEYARALVRKLATS